jgi:hypothetical protein
MAYLGSGADLIKRLGDVEDFLRELERQASRDRDYELAGALHDMRQAAERLRLVFNQDHVWPSGRGVN